MKNKIICFALLLVICIQNVCMPISSIDILNDSHIDGLNVNIAPKAQAISSESDNDSIVFDLNTEENISKNISGYGGATGHLYNSTEQALEIVPNSNTKNEPSTVFLDVTSKNISVENMPFIVLKVKLKDTVSMFGNISVATSGSLAYKALYGGNTYVMQMSSMYTPTSDWQILVVNIYDSAATYGSQAPDMPWIDSCNYCKLAVNLLKYNYKTWRETEGFFVKSIGFFSSKDAIREHYSLAPDSLPDSVEITENAYIFDLSTASNIGRNVTGFGGASLGIADSEMGALYVSPKVPVGNGTKDYGQNPSAFTMNVTSYHIGADEYPLFAMKVKLKDINSEFGRIAACTDGTLQYKELYGGVTYMIDTTNNGYEETEEWQIVIVDIWNSKESMGKKDLSFSWIEGREWRQLYVDLLPFNYYNWTENEGFYIEWAGFFKTRADIAAYVAN